MLYTASYFEPQFHHGQLIAISQTIPKGVRVDSRLEFLAPSKSLLADWKAENITQDQYIERYRVQIKESWKQVKSWLNTLSSTDDSTLVCWGKKGIFCHRNLIARLVKRHRPECLGGCDLLRIEMDKCREENLCKSGRGSRSQEKGSQLAAGGERATLFELSVGTPQLIVVLRVAPTKNSDILTAPLNQSTIGRRDINVDEGAVKMSGFIVTLSPPELFLGRAHLSYLLRLDN